MTNEIETVEIKREQLRDLLDRLTSHPEYFFSADFKTRNDRKNADGTIRPAGTDRHLVCKRKQNIKTTKDWTSKGGRLRFDPVVKQLFHVYTTEGPNGDDGTGNHWGFICLRSCWRVRVKGTVFLVADDEGGK